MNRATKRIDPATLEGKTPIGCGYKIFDWDWSAAGGYCYADERGEVEGSVHTVTGDLDKCGWGLHYCKNPLDYVRYRGIIPWNKFAYVEAYEENLDCDDGKSVCRTLKIVRVLSFERMINACRKYQARNDRGGYDTPDGCAIRGGYDTPDGRAIRGGYDILGGYNIQGGADIRGGSGVYGGCNIHGGRNAYGVDGLHGGSDIQGGSNIHGGRVIHGGSNIHGGYNVQGGYDVHGGRDIQGGSAIYGGRAIYGGSNIHGGSAIYGGCDINGGRNIHGGYDILHCRYCEGVSRCIFCFGLEGARLMLFNQPISEARYDEVRRKLDAWYPQFTNAEELRGRSGGEWSATPAHRITARTAREVYAEMPEALRAYVKSLPEYDDEIFRAITEDE